jgi:hypothetical protein
MVELAEMNLGFGYVAGWSLRPAQCFRSPGQILLLLNE